jgi:hypothetical protein
MKIKSKNLKQSYNSKPKGSLTLSSKFRLCTFRFSFLVFCLFTSGAGAATSSEQLDPTNLLVAHLSKPLSHRIVMSTPNVLGTPNALLHVSDSSKQVAGPPSAQQEQSQINRHAAGIAPVSSADGVDKKSARESSTAAGNSNSQVRRQLQCARITIPKNEGDEGNKNELQQIIKQIQSIEFKLQKDVSEPIIVVEPAPTTDPNETSLGTYARGHKVKTPSDTEESEEPREKEIESKQAIPRPYRLVTDRTLQKLKNVSQHPDQVNNPLELGEVLFLSDHLKEAEIFYQEALNRRNADDIGSAQDRAWILFQIGNCLRDRDRPMAIEMYRQLITEYPKSPWTDLAKAQDKLINWYQKDKPRTLVGSAFN